MRISMLVVASALAACATVPAFAAKAKTTAKPTYMQCEELAMSRGVNVEERRSSDAGPSPYRQFMVACLAGEVPFNAPPPATPVSIPGTPAGQQTASRWDRCAALAEKRGDIVQERHESDAGPSPWGQFMRSCMAGKIR